MECTGAVNLAVSAKFEDNSVNRLMVVVCLLGECLNFVL